MLLRVLGPIEVIGSHGTVANGAAKPRALLAALAIGRGSTCTVDALIDALWGESPPASASKLLQVYVSQLRKILPAGIRIATGATGYTLEIEPADIDSAQFEQLAADGRAALNAGNPALAASTLARALALWRGPAYADVRYEDFANEEVTRLERLRELTLETRLDADLQLGRDAEVLGELRGLLAANPTREAIAARAMLAAYRAAGSSEALAIFATVRRALEAELGEEPGPELVALRDRIARRDPALTPMVPASIRAGPALPTAPNALVGREREVAELRALLARPGVRLVSLTGSGGSGKSRLALELAHELEPTFANGAVLVELASLGDPELVPATIARGLGLDPGPDASATLRDALATREVLLVLDNVEHLRGAGAELVRLLGGAPRLSILVTTRVVLHVTGEHVYPVAPLAERDAVTLFAERAVAHDPSFALDDASEPLVASICRRLDGLPLAIELAAARVRALGLRALDAKLASRLTVLTGGPRDLPARQQTLRETLDWSVRLLEPAERMLLARVSVFAGGFTLDAVAEVCVDGDEDLAMELIGRLVDASLVIAEGRSGRMRYRLFDTVRDHAAQGLAQAGETGTTLQRLVDWCLVLAERTEPLLTGDGQAAAFATLETEHDNIRAALGFVGGAADPERRLRLSVAVSRFWYVRGHLAEGRHWLEQALADAGDVSPLLRRRALTSAAAIALIQGDYVAATSLSEQSLAAAREAGDQRLVANGLSNLGAIVLAAGDRQRAASLLDEAVALAREVRDDRVAALAINNLGDLALTEGDYKRAAPLFEESLALLRARGDTANVARSLFNLGAVALMRDDPFEARDRFHESLALGREAGDKEDLAWCLLGVAGLAAAGDDGERASLLLGAAVAVLEAIGAAFKPFERHLYETTAARARHLCGDEAFERARGRGARMSFDDAVDYARADASSLRPPHASE